MPNPNDPTARAVIQRMAALTDKMIRRFESIPIAVDCSTVTIKVIDLRALLDFALAASAGKRRAEHGRNAIAVGHLITCEQCAWDEARWLMEERKLYGIED